MFKRLAGISTILETNNTSKLFIHKFLLYLIVLILVERVIVLCSTLHNLIPV